jgi:hypothetical protein
VEVPGNPPNGARVNAHPLEVLVWD